LRSLGGKFFYNATSIYPACERALADRVFARAVHIMENGVASDAAAEQPLRDWIPAIVRDAEANAAATASAPTVEKVA
ncbi:MAG: hypothetical protein AAF772_17100, partial [Acidobacteriota bacterium]